MKTLRDKTGIQYLKFALDKDNKYPMVFDTAVMLQMEVMDNFSKWLIDNDWQLNYSNGNWEKLNDDIQILLFSELYQLFLKSREA